MSWFRRAPKTPQRAPYVADDTTWTCLACGVQAWTDGDKSGCGCPAEPKVARPLVADDPDHWSNRSFPAAASFNHGGDEGDNLPRDHRVEAYRELDEATDAHIAALQSLVEAQGAVVTAARHMMNVFAQNSASGVPIFKLNEDRDLNSVEILRHAILDLQAVLDGTEPPHFCLPDPERIH